MAPKDENKEADKLMLYFMGQTNERLTQIESKLLELITFRAEVLAHAKSTAIWVGVIASILNLIVGIVLRKVGL